MSKINVLFLDDEVQNLHAFKAAFRKFYNVSIASTPQEAISILRQKDINVFIVDQRMPEYLGTELIVDLSTEFPNLINILVTGYLDNQEFIDWVLAKGDVLRYIRKPWSDSEMKIAIEDAYKVYCLLQEKKKELDNLKKQWSDKLKAPIANLEGLLTLAKIEISDVYALKGYFQYMSESIETIKGNLHNPDLIRQN